MKPFSYAILRFLNHHQTMVNVGNGTDGYGYGSDGGNGGGNEGKQGEDGIPTPAMLSIFKAAPVGGKVEGRMVDDKIVDREVKDEAGNKQEEEKVPEKKLGHSRLPKSKKRRRRTIIRKTQKSKLTKDLPPPSPPTFLTLTNITPQ